MSTRDDSQKFYPTRNVGAVPAKRTDWQTRAEAAEARVADLEATARDLLDAMTRFGPGDSGQLWHYANALRALVGDETPEGTT